MPAFGLHAQGTINFCKHTWKVRDSRFITRGPGNNYWNGDKTNVWVDKSGFLHLKLTRDAANPAKWYCAQIESADAMGYGTYQFEIAGAIDKLNENVIFGMFSYPKDENKDLDGYDEIDIEYSRWGKKNNPYNYDYTAYGDEHHDTCLISKSHRITLTNLCTTQRYLRHPNKVVFESLPGFHDNDADPFQYDLIPASNKFKPSARPMPVLINLWLYKPHGSASKPIPPSDGKTVEIVIRSFKFTPE
jgi:hypothetical protein